VREGSFKFDNQVKQLQEKNEELTETLLEKEAEIQKTNAVLLNE
jgi:hypothetical protein